MLAIHESVADQAGPQRAFRMLLAGILCLAATTMVYGQWRDRQLQVDVRQLHDAVAQAREDQTQVRGRIARERLREGEERKRLEDLIADASAREERLRLLTVRRLAEEKSVRADLEGTRKRIAALETERAAGERIIRGGRLFLIAGRLVWRVSLAPPLAPAHAWPRRADLSGLACGAILGEGPRDRGDGSRGQSHERRRYLDGVACGRTYRARAHTHLGADCRDKH